MEWTAQRLVDGINWVPLSEADAAIEEVDKAAKIHVARAEKAEADLVTMKESEKDWHDKLEAADAALADAQEQELRTKGWLRKLEKAEAALAAAERERDEARRALIELNDTLNRTDPEEEFGLSRPAARQVVLARQAEPPRPMTVEREVPPSEGYRDPITLREVGKRMGQPREIPGTEPINHDEEAKQ